MAEPVYGEAGPVTAQDTAGLVAEWRGLSSALPTIARVIEEWLFGGASDEDTARHILGLVPPTAMQAVRHLRVAQVIYDDGPDESDKAQADLHMSAAILLAKRLVPYGDTRVSDADAHAVINSAPKSHLTGGRIG